MVVLSVPCVVAARAGWRHAPRAASVVWLLLCFFVLVFSLLLLFFLSCVVDKHTGGRAVYGEGFSRAVLEVDGMQGGPTPNSGRPYHYIRGGSTHHTRGGPTLYSRRPRTIFGETVNRIRGETLNHMRGDPTLFRNIETNVKK